MAGFWRKRVNDLSAPAKYIKTTDTVSSPLAVLLTALMLFVAFAVVFSVLSGGRWLIANLDGTNSNQPPETIITVQPPAGANETINSADQNAVATSSDEAAAPSDTGNTTTQQSGTASNSANQPTVVATGDTAGATTVPNSGPGSLLVLFVASTLLGTLGYRAAILRTLR